MDSGSQKELFSSVLDAIKTYNGDDPLRPWLRGIRKIQESLPPLAQKEKLPRFLQKCAQAFESDSRYRNDPRYLRVWIQLMDYVDDARVILKKMEKNEIGLKRATFYLAYALYYEKRKRFEDAEKMYHVGVQNLAEPVGELHKSYEQFVQRRMLSKKRKTKIDTIPKSKATSHSNPSHHVDPRISMNYKIDEGSSRFGDSSSSMAMETGKPDIKANNSRISSSSLGKLTRSCSDDTVVVKFVDSAIVGKSEAEDACHHGLVDPTINMKEAMNAISSMFREPLDLEPMVKRSQRAKPKTDQQSSGFEVYIDGSLEEESNSYYKSQKNAEQNSKKEMKTELQKPFVGTFEILADDDEDCKKGDDVDEEERPLVRFRPPTVHSKPSSRDENRLVCSGPREDTVIRRFVGSTNFDESEVENACHHGLVDPTINMKEAMDDINSMFGKPINFVKASRPKKQSNLLQDPKPVSLGFSILADDDSEMDSKAKSSSISTKLHQKDDLFEPTVFTKEAMADINEMFGKPLDF